LLDAVESSVSSSADSSLSLDYDKRRRAPPLERSAKIALEEFENTQQRIRNLFGDEASSAGHSQERSLDRSVQLSATTPDEIEFGSTLGREVRLFLLSKLVPAMTHAFAPLLSSI
jgi:hypothetical protein